MQELLSGKEPIVSSLDPVTPTVSGFVQKICTVHVNVFPPHVNNEHSLSKPSQITVDCKSVHYLCMSRLGRLCSSYKVKVVHIVRHFE